VLSRPGNSAAATDERRRFLRELAAASAVFLVFLAWLYRAPLLAGAPASLGQGPNEPPRALFDLSDMAFELQPALVAQARRLKDGVFPAWSENSQGGTPLLAKMQNGVFAPYHLPLYLLPSAWTPWLFTLEALVKSYLIFAFCYLLARALSLSPPAASLAGVLYFMSEASDGGLFAWNGAAAALPLLLLLTELYARGRRRWALLLLPWAAAYSFFAGYFESAVWFVASALVYYAVRTAGENESLRTKLGRAAAYVAALGAALPLAAAQIAPALEYVELSYNKVWHDPRGLWAFETIGKRLTLEDAPALLAGLLGAALFARFLRRAAASASDPWSPPEIRRRLGAAVLLAASVACLASAGLDDSMHRVVQPNGASDLGAWLFLALLSLLAAWESARARERGRRALAATALVGLVVALRVPPVSNLLAHLPVFFHFHNTTRRWDFQLGLAVLAAAALERLRATAALGAAERRREFRRALSLTSVLVVGLLLVPPLETLVEKIRPLGPWGAGAPRALTGEFADRGGVTYGGRWPVAGWWPRFPNIPPVASVRIGYRANGIDVASAAAAVTTTAARVYFRGELPPVPEGSYYITAQGTRPGRFPETIVHPQIFLQEGGSVRVRAPRGGAWGRWLLGAAALALPLALLVPAASGGVAGAVLIALSLGLRAPPAALSADRVPYALPGVERLRAEPGLFRIASLRGDFFRADYGDMYGLADLRTGGDNLDLLSEIVLRDLTWELTRDRSNPAAVTAGLKLLGVGNVRYLVEPPGEKAPPGGVVDAYRGPDMTLLRNPFERPRAAFYDRAVVVPLKSLDWADQRAAAGALKNLLLSGGADPATTLVLDDAPAAPFEASADAAPPPADAVRVEEYASTRVRLAVDAPRAGYVFLADNDFPGWVATVDGREVPILRSWLSFRSVAVPAGLSRVEFDYRPFPLRAALPLSALSVVLLVAVYARLRPRGEEPGEPAAATAEFLLAALILPCLLYWTLWSAFALGGPRRAPTDASVQQTMMGTTKP